MPSRPTCRKCRSSLPHRPHVGAELLQALLHLEDTGLSEASFARARELILLAAAELLRLCVDCMRGIAGALAGRQMLRALPSRRRRAPPRG